MSLGHGLLDDYKLKFTVFFQKPIVIVMAAVFIVICFGISLMFVVSSIAFYLIKPNNSTKNVAPVPPFGSTGLSTQPPAPHSSPTQPLSQPGEWKDSVASYYNMESAVQNDGWIGAVSCSDAKFNDANAWHVAITTHSYAGTCGRNIEIVSKDTGKNVTVPILDVMMEPTRKLNDLDLTVPVALKLGFQPYRDKFGDNKNIKWRFV